MIDRTARWLLLCSIVLLTIFLVHPAHADLVTLEDIVVAVDGAADTPAIDAASATSRDTCVLQSSGVPHAVIPVFHAASISKLFTAMMIMQLRDEGLLSLHDLVGSYEPAFAGSAIRIEHLLTHTSGLRDRQRADGRTSQAQVDAYIRALASQRIKQPPGTVWRYADAGYNLLGRVIERISEQSYAIVATRRLLLPLGMNNSAFDLAEVPSPARVVAFSKRGRQLKHPWDLAFQASSGLQTTAGELALFLQAILKSSQGDRQGVIAPETIAEMTMPRIDTQWQGIKQGYGWQLTGTAVDPQWRHAGGEAGFASLVTVYPAQDVGIAVLGNKKDWPRFQFERAMKRLFSCA